MRKRLKCSCEYHERLEVLPKFAGNDRLGAVIIHIKKLFLKKGKKRGATHIRELSDDV
jgi:hypothetical protein